MVFYLSKTLKNNENQGFERASGKELSSTMFTRNSVELNSTLRIWRSPARALWGVRWWWLPVLDWILFGSASSQRLGAPRV